MEIPCSYENYRETPYLYTLMKYYVIFNELEWQKDLLISTNVFITKQQPLVINYLVKTAITSHTCNFKLES